MAIVSTKTIYIYDSLLPICNIVPVLEQYPTSEYVHKFLCQLYNDNNWQWKTIDNCPQQKKDSGDCGVFLCYLSDFLSRNEPDDINNLEEVNTKMYRKHIALSINDSYIAEYRYKEM